MPVIRADRNWPILLSLLRGHRIVLAISVFVTILAALLELVPYALLSYSVTLLFDTAVTQEFFSLAGWIVLALAGKYSLYTFAYFLSHHVAFRVLMDTRQLLVRHLTWAPLTWLQGYSSGKLKTLVMQDVERLEQFIAHHLVEMTAAIVAPLLVVTALIWVDWRLALAAVATLPLALLFQSLAMRGSDRTIVNYQNALSDLNSTAVEYLRSMPVMKIFRQDANSFKRMREGLERYHDVVTRVTRKAIPGWSIFMTLLDANIVLLLPLGLWLAHTERITLGELLFALTLGNGMLKPLYKIVRFQMQIREILASARRLHPLLSVKKPAPSKEIAVDGFDLRFDRVSFGYDETPVLHQLSFQIPAHRITALVGPSGAGKSTVTNLLGRLIEPQKGEIRLGSHSLSSFSQTQSAQLLSVVTQDAFLFQGSLLDNLKLARPEASDEEVRCALRIAQALSFVNALPDGWNAHVGERGVTLSGGERQRIALARALLADAPILALDESTAFADSRTERRFFEALRTSYPDKTVLLIAHRLYTIKDAAQILVLEKGRLLDSGTHDKLMRRCPLYQQMWQAQTQSDRDIDEDAAKLSVLKQEIARG